MKLSQQESKFTPIYIILETSEEAELFWQAMRITYNANCVSEPVKTMAINIGNFFSNEAKL